MRAVVVAVANVQSAGTGVHGRSVKIVQIVQNVLNALHVPSLPSTRRPLWLKAETTSMTMMPTAMKAMMRERKRTRVRLPQLLELPGPQLRLAIVDPADSVADAAVVVAVALDRAEVALVPRLRVAERQASSSS